MDRSATTDRADMATGDRTGERNVTDAADMTQLTQARRAATPRTGHDAGDVLDHPPCATAAAQPPLRHDRLVPLTDIAAEQWQGLADRAVEPNAYYLPDWEAAVNASARDRGGAMALTAWGYVDGAGDATARLIGLLPVVSAWRAYRIPIPALVSADAYGPLGTALLDRDAADEAAHRMLRQARVRPEHER